MFINNYSKFKQLWSHSRKIWYRKQFLNFISLGVYQIPVTTLSLSLSLLRGRLKWYQYHTWYQRDSAHNSFTFLKYQIHFCNKESIMTRTDYNNSITWKFWTHFNNNSTSILMPFQQFWGHFVDHIEINLRSIEWHQNC